MGGSSGNDPAAELDFHEFLFKNGTIKLRELVEKINDINNEQKVISDENVERIDDMFLVINACTVLFMQCGFALLEAGAVRAKNVTNILIKNLLDACLGSLIYYICGFAFAYGQVAYKDDDGNYHYSKANSFIGHYHFFLMDPTHHSYDIPGYEERVIHHGSFYGEWFFNFVFAATATTIISGALAERVEFGSYLIYGVAATGFIQPVTVHWAWSNGWLVYPPDSAGLPPDVWYRDYAGGGNVHAVGGMAALVGAIFIGPRIGRFEKVNEEGPFKKYHIPGHSTPLTCLGAFILIIGFLSMALGHGDNLAVSASNIIIGGSVAGLTSMFIKWIKPKIIHVYKTRNHKGDRKISVRQYWSFIILVDATLCGMVAMCAGCNVLEPWAAIVIGILAGAGYTSMEHMLVSWQIDDPVGSFPVHYVGGFLGVVLTPIFANKEQPYSWVYWKGCDYDCVRADDDFESTCVKTKSETVHFNVGDCLYTPYYQFAWQLVGIIAISLWTLVLCAILFAILWHFEILRVHPDTECRGIDIQKHGEPAYPQAAYGHGWDSEGQFSMEVLDLANAGDMGGGRRNVKALMNPNKKDNWAGMSTDEGLIEMAIAYRKQYYHEPLKKKKNSELTSNGSVPTNGGLGNELFGDTFINSYKNGAVQTSNQSTIM